MDAENVPEVHKLHWWFFVNKLVPWLLIAVLLVLLGQVTALSPLIHDIYQRFYYYAAAIILVLMVIGFLIGFAQWSFTTLTLDRSYLIFETGILRRSVSKIPVQEIASIDLQQSIFQRFLNMGDLVVDMRGASLLRMRGLEDPLGIQNKVMELRK